MSAVSIKFGGLTFAFKQVDLDGRVFDEFTGSLELTPGELTILGGNNGVGKSVLGRLIAGQQKPTNGPPPLMSANGQPIPVSRIFYLPQNLESGGDRFAIDLFSAVAGIGRRRRPPRLRSCLEAAGITRSEMFGTCDRFTKPVLLGGVLASARLSNMKLLILDEPLSQLTRTERKRVETQITEFARTSGIFTLVIAHPDQVPSSGTRYQLLVEPGAAGKPTKVLRRRKDLARQISRVSPSAGLPAFEMTCSGALQQSFTLARGTVNLLASPDEITTGQLGSLLVQAFKKKGSGRVAGTLARVESLGSTGDWPNSIKYLPPDAQTSVVPLGMRVSDASLYDRWRDAPRTPVRRIIDRRRLERGIFEEGQYFFPVEPSDPSLRGHQLSGGNRQMMALRAVAYPLPDLLVVSCVYSGLDEENAEKVDHFLGYAAASGTIVVSIDPAG